jgi:cytochrome c2
MRTGLVHGAFVVGQIALLAGCADTAAERVRDQGILVLHQHGCNSCHVIPGVTGSNVHIGPPLDGMARRATIAGELANTHANLVRWLVDPQGVDPRTAMPAMGMSEADAAAAAAYLLTLR